MAGSQDRQFSVFADDSVSGHFAVYGQVGTHIELLPAILEVLSKTKEAVGVSPSAPFHCQELFHAGKRAKTQWAHLSESDVSAMCSTIALDLAQSIRPLISIGILNMKKMPKRLLVTSPHPTGLDPVVNLSFEKQREKQALAFAFSAAFTGFQVHANMSPADVRIVISNEESKIDWLQSRRKAHHAAADLVHGFDIKIEKTHPALELADMVAYLGGHLASGSHKTALAKEVFQCLKPLVHEFTFTPYGWNHAAINYPRNERVIGRSDNVTERYFDIRTY